MILGLKIIVLVCVLCIVRQLAKRKRNSAFVEEKKKLSFVDALLNYCVRRIVLLCTYMNLIQRNWNRGLGKKTTE